MDNETFGQRLSRIRKEKGLTQEDIAKRIVISPQAVSKWENDVSSPDILVLSSLADILGVSVDELLGHEKKSKAEEVESEVVDDEDKYQSKAENNPESKFTMDDNGIHIQDKDGSYVHINKSGIHVKDAEETVDVSKEGVYVNGEKKTNFVIKKENTTRWVTSGTFFGLAIIGYILMGLLWTDGNLGWTCGWTLFLFAIAFESLVEAIIRKRFCAFVWPVFVTAAYCLLGFLGAHYGFPGFGFYWFLFLTIPAYYLIFGPIDKALHAHNIGYDED